MSRELPSVSTIVATQSRPELLRRTLRSIAAQDYAGDLSVCVVFDNAPVDDLDDLRAEFDQAGRGLAVITNTRTPGLAGARNSGIAATDGELVAFCDDDDEWTPGKITGQVELLGAHPEAVVAAASVRIITLRGEVTRLAPALTTRSELLQSRVAGLHPSTFVTRRSVLDRLDGPVDEALPGGYGEDHDFLLAATEHGTVVGLQDVGGIIHWDRVSHFAGRWPGMAAGLTYMLDKHPELLDNSRNAARMSGQIAFAHAAQGDRAISKEWITRARQARLGEWRVWAATAVNTGIVRPAVVMRAVNSLGRGV